MPLVDRLERKYGWIAIPGIVRILVGFQLLVFLLTLIRSDNGLVVLLGFSPSHILSGEVWRLVSFALVPPTLTAPLFMVFYVFFTFFLGDILEQSWGSFRLTLYVLGGIVGIVVGGFFAYFLVGHYGFFEFAARAGLLPNLGFVRSLWVTMLLLAVAVLEPGRIVNLMGVIPIKIMWLALFAGAMVVLDLIVLTGKNLLLPIALLLAISNFLIVFGPSAIRQMKQRSEVAARRNRFESSKMPESEPLHRCATCDKTENDGEELEFRVAADGEEYCTKHLPVKVSD